MRIDKILFGFKVAALLAVLFSFMVIKKADHQNQFGKFNDLIIKKENAKELPLVSLLNKKA